MCSPALCQGLQPSPGLYVVVRRRRRKAFLLPRHPTATLTDPGMLLASVLIKSQCFTNILFNIFCNKIDFSSNLNVNEMTVNHCFPLIKKKKRFAPGGAKSRTAALGAVLSLVPAEANRLVQGRDGPST